MAPVSPYRIALGILVQLHVTPREQAAGERQWSSLVQAVRAASHRQTTKMTDEALFLLDEFTSAAEGQDRGTRLEHLLEAVTHAIGDGEGARELAHHLQQAMQALQTPDDLLCLLILWKDVLSPPQSASVDGTSLRPSHIDPESLLGLHMRQLVLDSHGTGFEGLSIIVDRVRQYILGEGEHGSQVKGMRDFGPEATPEQMQSYLQRRTLEVEKEVGLRTFGDTEDEIARLLWRNPELPRAHFLRYVNSKQHKEFVGAIDGLHRYFDYAIRRGGPNSSSKPSSSRALVQYAVLNLAALHLHFGHADMALTAINETVRLAQQNGDHACVAYSLAWLHRLFAGSGNRQAEEVLAKCISRASDQKLRHLQSSATLSLAGLQALGGQHLTHNAPSGAAMHTEPSSARRAADMTGSESAGAHETLSRPRQVWTALRMSAVDAASASATPAAAVPPVGPAAQAAGSVSAPTMPDHSIACTPLLTTSPLPFDMSSAGISLTAALQSQDSFPLVFEEVSRLAAGRCLVAAGAWEMLGHRELAQVQARKALCCYARDMSNAERSMAVIKRALARLRGPQCASSQQAVRCAYGLGLQDLASLRERFPVPIKNMTPHSLALVLHEWALHRGENRLAHELGRLVRSLSPAIDDQGIEAHVEAQMQYTAELLHAGHFAECVRATENLAAVCQARGLPWHYVRLLLQLSHVHLMACPNDMSAALPPLLRCLSVCESFDMDTPHAMASLLLAQVQLGLGSWPKARAVMRAALPVLLEQAPAATQGHALLTLTKCHLQQASSMVDNGEVKEDDPGLVELLQRACSLLPKAFSAFSACESIQGVIEAYYLQARISHQLAGLSLESDRAQHVRRRDEAAMAFHEASARAAAAKQTTLDVSILQDLDALRGIAVRM